MSYTFCFRDSTTSFQEARENLGEAKKQDRKRQNIKLSL